MRILADIWLEAVYDFFPVICPIEEWMFECFLSVPWFVQHDTGDVMGECFHDIMISIIDEERDTLFSTDDSFRLIFSGGMIDEVYILY